MRRLTLAVFCAAALTGCDTEFFNSGCRDIGDTGYSLCRNEDGPTVFYLEPNDQSPSGGGVLNGTVESIGWSDKTIVASRHSTFRGDRDGLMIVDIASKKIYGPIDQSVATKDYRAIKLTSAADAWAQLR